MVIRRGCDNRALQHKYSVMAARTNVLPSSVVAQKLFTNASIFWSENLYIERILQIPNLICPLKKKSFMRSFYGPWP
jgi:hypothetical protein